MWFRAKFFSRPKIFNFLRENFYFFYFTSYCSSCVAKLIRNGYFVVTLCYLCLFWYLSMDNLDFCFLVFLLDFQVVLVRRNQWLTWWENLLLMDSWCKWEDFGRFQFFWFSILRFKASVLAALTIFSISNLQLTSLDRIWLFCYLFTLLLLE